MNWYQDAVVYEVYLRSFADSDGDGVGDLPGLTAKLDHLAVLGVDAVWVTPFYRSPMADHGYDVTDPTDVDPLFGDLAAFDAMLAEAHRARPEGRRGPGPQPHLPRAPVVRRGAGRPGVPGPVALRVPARGATAGRPTTGRASSAARRGARRPTARGTCTCSTPASPTSSGPPRRCTRTGWTCCGSGSTAGSTGSASTWRTRSTSAPTSPTRARLPPLGGRHPRRAPARLGPRRGPRRLRGLAGAARRLRPAADARRRGVPLRRRPGR